MQILIYLYVKKGGMLKMVEKAHLSVRIPKELMKDLKIAAIKKEITLTDMVVMILEDYLHEP